MPGRHGLTCCGPIPFASILAMKTIHKTISGACAAPLDHGGLIQAAPRTCRVCGAMPLMRAGLRRKAASRVIERLVVSWAAPL